MGFDLLDKKAVNFSEAELKSFLATRRIVIAESGASSGRSVRKFLMQYGAKSDSTFICETYEQAKNEIAAKPTHLLFSDFALGLDLVALQESRFPNRAEVASVILGVDPSSDAMGTIAEANVDAMLIKPFNFQTFKDALFQALANKVKPSQYWVSLENGKKCLNESLLEEAEKTFEAAKALDPQPTLAFYYLAKVLEMKGDLAAATKVLKEGLDFNSKDYRCLSALFEVYLRGGNHQEAYDLAKAIHKEYPVSTARIPDLVKLSVFVRKFGDIVDYYEIFKNLERREPLLNRVVIAGMLVCAKYFFAKAETSLCREVLQNAAEVSLKTEVLMPDVLRYFAETAQGQAGVDFFNKLPEATQKLPECQMVYVELVNQTGNFTEAVHWGTQLLQKGVTTPRLYEVVIAGSMKTGRNTKAIQDLIAEAKEKFPSAAVVFERAGVSQAS